MAAIKIGDHELELKTGWLTKDDCEYDPHLQEEKLRYEAKLPGTCDITRDTCDGSRCAEVIVKLKPGGQVPDGLTLFQTEGIGGGSYISEEKVGDQTIRKVYINGNTSQTGERSESSEEGDGDDNRRPPSLIFTGEVDLRKIVEVRKSVESLKAARPVHLHLFHSVPAIRCDPSSLDAGARKNGEAYPGLDGSDVIVGIVDFGCDFRHRNFRKKSGETRILYLWDQTDDEGRSSSEFPQEYHYGRELTSEMINRALASGDENAYGVLGYVPPLAAHGTHVMDVAAGNGGEPDLFNGRPGSLPPQPSTPGIAPNAQIIFVQLKQTEGSVLTNSRRLLEAVDYIFKKADALNLPAVVNLSLSTTGGPHDGTTLMEQAFEALVTQKPGRAIVTSAGNAYALKSHASGDIPAGTDSTATLLWETDPFNTDPRGATNEVEIWYPKDGELVATLSVPKNEDSTQWAVLGSVNLGETKILLDGGDRIGRISHRKDDPNNHDNLIDIRLPHLRGVSGPWKIELASKAGTVHFDAWIEQSERGLSRFQGKTDPSITLGSISCGKGTLTVGAYDTSERAALALPYEFTSAGPIRGEKTDDNTNMSLRRKPELSAPGVNVVAARAQGGVTIMSGTSMAAPHVTGLIAILFQLAHKSGRGPLSFEKTREILTKGLESVQDPTLRARLGAGRINGAGTVKALLETVMRSVYLDLRLTRPEVRSFVYSKPTIDDLFKFLKDHAALNGHNGFKVDEFVQFFQEQLGKNEFFRLTMASLS